MTLIFILTLAVIGATGTAAFTYFWNTIRDFLNGTVRDLITKACGEEWGNQFAELVVWIDEGAVLVKKTAQDFWNRFFEETITKIETKYEISQKDNKATKTIITLVRLPSGLGQQTITTQEVHWHDLPADVRQKVILEKADTMTINEMEIIEKQYKNQLEMVH